MKALFINKKRKLDYLGLNTKKQIPPVVKYLTKIDANEAQSANDYPGQSSILW